LTIWEYSAILAERNRRDNAPQESVSDEEFESMLSRIRELEMDDVKV
jgi:hypothetical protein